MKKDRRRFGKKIVSANNGSVVNRLKRRGGDAKAHGELLMVE
jgi:hypothetical protein